jgi:ParB/RepB/Spo0J family partition protein
VVLRGRNRGQKRFQIISGFRRCNAAKSIGWTEISAIVRPSDFSEEDAFRASVLENTERKTYSDIDRAYVIRAYRSRGLGSIDIGELMGLSKRQTNNIYSLLELPDSVQAAIDDPEQHFGATHGLTLKKLARKYEGLDFDAWVSQVNEHQLSVASLTRQVNQEYRPALPNGFKTIFNSTSTDLGAGQVRLMPIKFTVGDLTEAERNSLKGELQALISLL